MNDPRANEPRVEAGRVEEARVDGASVEGARVEGARVQGSRVEGARVEGPRVEGPSPEVERPEGSAALPGASKGYGKLPTAPVPMPIEREVTPDAEEFAASGWAPSAQAEQNDDARLAPWALFAAIVALATSMFVGWGIPVAIVAVIAAIMTLRRPVENRSMALWALVLGLFATLFSTGWLIWAAMQFELLG